MAKLIDSIISVVSEREKRSPDAVSFTMKNIDAALTKERELCPPEAADITQGDILEQIEAMEEDDLHKVTTYMSNLLELKQRILDGKKTAAVTLIDLIIREQAMEDLI